MAQVTFKHGTVQNSRHIVRNLVSASLAMLRTLNRGDLNEKGERAYDGAVFALLSAQKTIHGQRGMGQEEQVSRMEHARDRLNEARKAVVVMEKAHEDKTSHQKNMYESVYGILEEAKSHLTSGRQFAKDRRFVPKIVEDEHDTDVDTEDEIADVPTLIEEKEQGLG